MADIDDKHLDIDFTKDPNYVFGDLGCAVCGSFADYADAAPTMSDIEIDAGIEKLDDAASMENLITRVFMQAQEGSCVANATSQGDEIVQAGQVGKDKVVQLSAISLYKRIGRSPSSGSMVSDALDELNSRGILPLDNEANRARFGSIVMPNTGFYTAFPHDWESVAALFAGREYYIVRSVNSLMTALLNGHPVVVGRQGHSICYVRPMHSKGRRIIKYVNSWGNWGDKGGDFPSGFGYDSPGTIQQAASWAFAIRSVVVPSVPQAV